MSRIRQTVSVALVLAMLSLGLTTAEAQRRTWRMNDRQINNLITRVEQSADRFRASVDRALDRSRIDGTASEDNINNFIRDFEAATDQLRSRFNGRNAAAADVENVLQKAALINDFMARNRLSRGAQSDWTMLRNDLNALAQAYNVSWNWGAVGIGTGTGTGIGVGTGTGRAYRLTDREVNRIIARIETNTDRFRASVDRGLDRSRYDGTRAEDNINDFIRDFEASTDQLRSRFNGNTSVDEDVINVLQRAASIDRFMRDNQLPVRAENDWTLVRNDLNALADAYAVTWNWNNVTYPTTGSYPNNTYPNNNPTYASGSLSGTYRIDPSRSDDARTVADRATRNLPLGERQRVHDRVVARLESPEQIAIERRGRTVQIASSRAPQTTFEADNIERTETLANGVTARVRANLSGETLEVRSTGFRENDFVVTFQPIDNGRRLRVTRQIFSDRLGAQPVVVNDIYDKISESARFDIYTGAGAYNPGESSSVGSGVYNIRNGETLVAVLDQDLSTKTATEGQRFTMTVRSPVEYEGAVIEGTIGAIDRSGRVTGRSELALNFDTIRLRNGSTSRFAGFIETVRTPAGETVNVDNEGTVRDDNQTNRTVQRTAIGSAVGAIIGAIAGGGKGAAIGAVIGAAGGAGSVYVQGRDDLELQSGTELTIRASAPNR
ncbi:MAG TPA: YMGG-like glycine zipper-containing protein [Pyrinomonadaceae bacterium]|nr:YMGG-like glycine zipper-containing protein [Pyrinomonadaceae bacterium]